MKKLLFLLSLVCIMQVNAQITFQKTYGTAAGEQLGSLLKTADGGFIMAGQNDANSRDVYIVKTDSNGVIQWAKTYGTTFSEQAMHINSTADGGYIITGEATDTATQFNSGKALLLKIKADGTIQWSKCYGRQGEGGQHVQQTIDKGYIVIGGSGSYSSSDHLYVFKTDSLGALQWSKVIAGQGCCGQSDFPASIMQTADSNYVLLATVYSHQANTSVLYLAKINAATDTIQWQTTLIVVNPGSGNYAASFVQTPDKGFIITGDCAQKGVILVKTDSVGVYQWGKQYGISSGTGVSVIQTNDGGFAFAGNNYIANNIFICKTNQTGDLQWAKALGDTTGGKVSTIQTLVQNSNDQYILGSTTNKFGAGSNDFYLLKTDTSGSTNCNSISISPTTTVTSGFSDFTPVTDTVGAESTLIFLSDTGCTQNTICYNVGAINKITHQAELNIYPNPAQNIFVIETNNAEKQTLTLFDIRGKLLLTQLISGTASIDVSKLADGIYNLSITGSTEVANKKLVIVH